MKKVCRKLDFRFDIQTAMIYSVITMQTQNETRSSKLNRRARVINSAGGSRGPIGAVGVDLTKCTGYHDVLQTLKVPTLHTEDVVTTSGLKCEGRKAVVTDQNPTVVGNVTDRYKLIQPAAAIRPICQAVADSRKEAGGRALQLNRGKVIDGGRLVWMKASMGTGRPVGSVQLGETARCDLTLRAPNDGTGSVIVDLSIITPRCWNGMVSVTKAGRFIVRHLGDTDTQMNAFREAIDGAWREWARSLRVLGELTETRLPTMVTVNTNGQRARVPVRLQEVIRIYTAAVFGRAEMERQHANGGGSRRSDALMQAYVDGHGGKPADRPAVDGTGYGLLAALTDYQTHGREMTDSRFESLTSGTGASQARRGIEVAHAMTTSHAWTLEDLLDNHSPVMQQARVELAA